MNNTILFIILFMMLLFIIWVYILPDIETETLENMDSNIKLDIIKQNNNNNINIINQNIHVKCYLSDLQNKMVPYYLTIISKNQYMDLNTVGSDIKYLSDFAILSEQKNTNININTFKFSKNLITNEYILKAQHNKLDILNDKNSEKNTIYFTTRLVNNGYHLIYKQKKNKSSQDLYVGICDNSVHNINGEGLRELCLYSTSDKAIVFQFEIKLENFDNNFNLDLENLSLMTNCDSCKINSEYSFGSIDSKKTLMSLPGAGSIEDGNNFESCKPWIED